MFNMKNPYLQHSHFFTIFMNSINRVYETLYITSINNTKKHNSIHVNALRSHFCILVLQEKSMLFCIPLEPD